MSIVCKLLFFLVWFIHYLLCKVFYLKFVCVGQLWVSVLSCFLALPGWKNLTRLVRQGPTSLVGDPICPSISCLVLWEVVWIVCDSTPFPYVV